MPHQIEGIDYSRAGIHMLKNDIVEVRAKAMQQMPESAGFVVLISHVIAILSWAAELHELPEAIRKEAEGTDGGYVDGINEAADIVERALNA